MRSAFLFLLLIVSTSAVSAPLTASQSSAGVGVAVAGVEQSASILGVDTSSRGALVGLHATVQRGVRFRGEARLLGGSLDGEAGNTGTASNTLLLGARGTWGTEIGDGDRLYAGVGIEHLNADSPLGSGDSTTSSVYVPVGLTRYADWYEHWQVAVSLEGQLLLVSRSEIDGVRGTRNQSFSSAGGAGFRLTAKFQPRDTPLTITPYLHMTATADSSTEQVQGVAVRIEDQQTSEAGLRLSLRF